MLKQLNEFRQKLDSIMIRCIHKRIVIYGYDTYTGRFLKWYAEYYHSLNVDFLVSEDMSVGKGYDREIFRPSVFDFGYKDIRNAAIWLAQPLDDTLQHNLENWGFIKNISYYDFYEEIYGADVYLPDNKVIDVYHMKKTGKRDIQFLEFLEWKYGCNFITPVSKDSFKVVDCHGARYSCSTQKEIFPMLDRCHFHPSENDALFDYGYGKGGALVSFLDYGFRKVGGVELESGTREVAKENFALLEIDDSGLLCGDARNITFELDDYNWFYFFFPFDKTIFINVIKNLCDSYKRKKRKMVIIYFTAMDYTFIEDTGIFTLTNEFTVDSRQRVVGIFETK